MASRWPKTAPRWPKMAQGGPKMANLALPKNIKKTLRKIYIFVYFLIACPK
jgi:hypothetical protein